MLYRTVADAYQDLERTTGRHQLIARLAVLLAETPAPLLPTVCHLCQARIAPEFAGVQLGLAEKSAARALADIVSAPSEHVLAVLRDTGDLGRTAEQLLAGVGPPRSATLTVGRVVGTLDQIAASTGPGSQGRKLALLAGLLEEATPVEARYLMRLVTGTLRLGIGTPTILDALATVYGDGRTTRPILERAYNICCDIGLVAAKVAEGGPVAAEALHVRPGNPIRAMLAQRASEVTEVLDRLDGGCAAEYKYDGMRVQAHRTGAGEVELYTRRLERVSGQFPDVVRLLDGGLRPRAAIVEAEVVAADPATGELRPFQEVMYRRRKHGIAEAVRDVPVSLFCFDLLYADGEDLTRLPYPQRRARLAAAIETSPRLRLATAIRADDAPALESAFQQAVTDGCEGLVCKSLGPSSGYRAGARGWQWIKLKRDYRAELSDTLDLVVVGGLFGRGRRRGTYGALLLAAYDPETDTFPTICKCGTGFTDAEIAVLPDRLAPLTRPTRPARVDARVVSDVWFEPHMVIEVLGAELTLSPHHTAGRDRVKSGAGLALRFPRFTGRYREDKAAEDATTIAEAVQLFRAARGGSGPP